MILLSSNIPCGFYPKKSFVSSDHSLAAIHDDLDSDILSVIQTGVDGQDLGPLPAKGFLTVNNGHGGFLSLVLLAECHGAQAEVQMP
jgi:hypothetical protein